MLGISSLVNLRFKILPSAVGAERLLSSMVDRLLLWKKASWMFRTFEIHRARLL